MSTPATRRSSSHSGFHPIATPPPMVRLSTCVVFSIRSAAAFSALATAVWVARAVGGGDAHVAQDFQFFLQRADALAGVEQFVAHRQRRHHGQPRIADLAELAAQLGRRATPGSRRA